MSKSDNYRLEKYWARMVGKVLVTLGVLLGVSTGAVQYLGSEAPATEAPSPRQEGGKWQKYDYDKYRVAKDAGQPVLLYFGADWCKYCKINKIYTHEKEFLSMTAERGIVLLYIDMTHLDKKMHEVSDSYRVRGLPTYIMEHADGDSDRWVGAIGSYAKFLKGLGL